MSRMVGKLGAFESIGILSVAHGFGLFYRAQNVRCALTRHRLAIDQHFQMHPLTTKHWKTQNFYAIILLC